MDMVEAESNSCLMHEVFLIHTMPFGITYQKAFRSSPVNPGKRLEETLHTVVTFSSSQNILQSHQINLPSHPPLSGQLLGGSFLPFSVSLAIPISTGRLPQTFPWISQTHSVTSTLCMLPALCTSLVI